MQVENVERQSPASNLRFGNIIFNHTELAFLNDGNGEKQGPYHITPRSKAASQPYPFKWRARGNKYIYIWSDNPLTSSNEGKAGRGPQAFSILLSLLSRQVNLLASLKAEILCCLGTSQSNKKNYLWGRQSNQCLQSARHRRCPLWSKDS